jgi:hypothetical protein
MQRRTRRIWIWLALILGGATVFQTVGFSTNGGAISGGCRDFALNGVSSAVDMCFLLDCQSGFFGGLVNPCDPQNPALLDCSNAGSATTEAGGTTGSTGTTSGFGG